MEVPNVQIKSPFLSEFFLLRVVIFSLFLLLIVAPLQAKPSYEKNLDEFFSLLSGSNAAEAMDGLIATNPTWYKAEHGLGETISQLDQLQTIFGAYVGHERVGKFEYGERIRVLTYLVYHMESVVRMVFVFYRPDKAWRIMNFNFSEVTAEELMEAASAYLRD